MFSNKITNVPQYKGLTVGNILKFARSKTNIDESLPENDYSKESCRPWFCNFVNTLFKNTVKTLFR